MTDVRNILIVKLSAIGDVIHTLPALNALRKRFPQARITWVVESAAADLIQGHPALDRVIVSDRKRWIRGLKTRRWAFHLAAIRRFIRQLRDTRYDLIFDFQAHLKGAVLIALARGRRKIGFGPGMEHQEFSYWALTERVPAMDMDIHALVRGLMLLNAVGIPTDDVAYRLPVTDAHRRSAMALLPGPRTGRPCVAINPVALWETKLWDPEGFAQLADRLAADRGATVVFTGGPADRPVVRSILDRMATTATDLSGRTDLMTLAAVYAAADLLVTTDTGPMHLAAVVNTPTVAIFGPTAPWRTGPFGDGHQVVRAEVTCSPCFKRRCDAGHGCMAGISVDAVMGAVDRVLADLPHGS